MRGERDRSPSTDQSTAVPARRKPATSPSSSAEPGQRRDGARVAHQPDDGPHLGQALLREPLGLGERASASAGSSASASRALVTCSSETVSACPITSCSSWAIRTRSSAAGPVGQPGLRLAQLLDEVALAAGREAREGREARCRRSRRQPARVGRDGRTHRPSVDHRRRGTTSAGQAAGPEHRPAGQQAVGEQPEVGGVGGITRDGDQHGERAAARPAPSRATGGRQHRRHRHGDGGRRPRRAPPPCASGTPDTASRRPRPRPRVASSGRAWRRL